MPETRQSRRLVLVTATALLLTVGGALSFVLYQARESELEDWRTQLSNTSLLLAQQTANEMASANLALDDMLERVRLAGVHDDASLRRLMGSEAEFRRLVDHTKVLPQIDVASIVAANGDVVNFSRSYPAPPINLSERDYFKAHRERPGPLPLLSNPVRNKGNGQWTFYLSRRLDTPDGRFLGVVLVGIASRELSAFFSKINLGDDATVTLYRRDFVTLARWPHSDALMGSINKGGSSFEIIERQQRSNGVVIVNTPRQADQGRRTTRMGAVRLIPNYPMIINITVTERLFMAQWREFAWQLGVVGAICCVAVVAAFAILLREMGRRDNAVMRQRALKAEADAANRAKTDFLAMMSHEIRTPLTAVIGFAEQVEDVKTVREAEELGSIIARNGHLLLALINDILDMSKIESGRLELESAPFSPSEALNAVELLMRGQAERRGIVFDSSLDKRCPALVLGDPTRWRQILINLVSNAVKFTEQGSVCIAVWYEKETAMLYCRVSDTGVGMDDAQIARLFKPFEQADSTISRRFGGTGLGLYLVQQLTQAMGGSIKISSGIGDGTSITVAIQAPAAALPQATAHQVPIPLGKLRGKVLLVEDGEDNRRLISVMLQRMGLQVHCANDGRAGVIAAKDEQPDLILMDIQMPVLDGLAATRELRQHGFASPIIALTANVMANDRSRYEASGFDGCIAKPLNREEFEQTLNRFLPGASSQAGFADLPEFAAIQFAFFESLRCRMDKVEDALQAGDLATVQMEAHLLKGSAATFGCPRIGATAAHLERACRAADMRAVDAGLQALQDAVALESAHPPSR